MMVDLEIQRQPGWTYRLLDRRQREVAARVREGGPGALLLSEVEPVITLGRRTVESDLLMSREQLAQRGIDVYEIDRGGFATYHGPGQWVLFAVDTLEALTGDSRGVRKAVDGLLRVAAEVAGRYAAVEIRDGAQSGVWSRQGKVASVGVHIEEGVLLHGLALNAYRTPTSFLGIRPCGLEACAGFLWEEPSEAKFMKLGEELAHTARQTFYGVLDPSRHPGYKDSSSSRTDHVGA